MDYRATAVALLILSIGITAVGIAVGDSVVVAENGSVEFSNGKVNITDKNAGFHLRLPKDTELRYTENESWDSTITRVSGDGHYMYFDGSQEDDNADWYSANMTAWALGEVYMEVDRETPTRTRVDIINASTGGSGITFSGSKNDITITDTITEITLTNISTNDTSEDISWNITGQGSIQIRDLPTNKTVVIRSTQTDEVVGVDETGESGSIDHTIRENRSVYLTEEDVGVAGDIHVTPTFQLVRLNTATQNLTVNVEVENTGDESRLVNISSDNQYIEPSRDSVLLPADASQSILVTIKGSKSLDNYQVGDLQVESNQSTSVYFGVERPGSPQKFTDNSFFGLPTWAWMTIVMFILVIVFVGFWVKIEPNDSPNLWY